MLSGGSKRQDVNRPGQDGPLERVLGSDRIPRAATIGKAGCNRQPRHTRGSECPQGQPRHTRSRSRRRTTRRMRTEPYTPCCRHVASTPQGSRRAPCSSITTGSARPGRATRCYPVAVVGCRVHGRRRYTLYPAGHYSNGRVAVVAYGVGGELLREADHGGRRGRRRCSGRCRMRRGGGYGGPSNTGGNAWMGTDAAPKDVRIPVNKATHSGNKKPPGGCSNPDTATIAGWLFEWVRLF